MSEYLGRSTGAGNSRFPVRSGEHCFRWSGTGHAGSQVGVCWAGGGAHPCC